MASSISLTRAATTTTTATLFSKLLRSTHSRSMAAPYTSRSFNTNSTDSTQDHFKTDVNIQSLIEKGRALIEQVKEAVKDKNIPSELLEVFCWHPFLRQGPKCPSEVKADGENLYARIDMPGVGKEGVKVWMEEDDLYFVGEGVEKNPENGNVEFVRIYSSSMYIPPGGYETDKVKCVVKNGVVWIVVPRSSVLELGDMGTFSRVKVEFC